MNWRGFFSGVPTIFAFIFLLSFIFFPTQYMMIDARVDALVAQVKSIEAAVTTFRDTYNAFPGDMANAGDVFRGCPGEKGKDCNPAAATANNSIIGDPDFASLGFKPQKTGKTQVPAESAADETILFWSHLLKTDLISGVTEAGLKTGSPIAFKETMPAARIGGGLIVGYSNGAPLPKSLSPSNNPSPPGTVLVLVSDEALGGKVAMNAENAQVLTPKRAALVDRKMDDGKPHSGFVQAYGSPYCFKPHPDKKTWKYRAEPHGLEKFAFWKSPSDDWRPEDYEAGDDYAEMNSGKECGLIFRIQGAAAPQ